MHCGVAMAGMHYRGDVVVLASSNVLLHTGVCLHYYVGMS